jgi:anti-anti-sigma factor
MIQITDRVEADRTILTLSGRFEFQARQPFQTAIENAKRSNPRQIILNFSEVPFINSAGLGLLMVAHTSLQKDNIRLSLEVTEEGYVLQVLTLANIGQKIPISVNRYQN